MSKKEVRAFRLPIELRDDEGDGLPSIRGHAAVFNKKSEDLGGFREVIMPGAFDSALERGDDVRALVDHDVSKIIGRTKAGTLTLNTDSKGLRVQITPPDTSVGRDIVESIRRKDIDSMSFGFRTIEDRWRTVDGEEIRELMDLELFDVSPVSFPAYPQTDVAVRSLNEWRNKVVPTVDPEMAEREKWVADMKEKHHIA
jgi:HK97 family phage prohead protease